MAEVKINVDDWYQPAHGRRIHRRRDDLVEVDDRLIEWLLRSGIAVLPGEPQEAEDTMQEEPPAGEGQEYSEDTPEEEKKTPRPLSAANRATWDAYARTQGVDPAKFKSKEELIAALP